jgi:uncharacterized membrane protein
MFFIELNQNFGEQTEFLAVFIITVLFIWTSLFLYFYKKWGYKRTIIYFLPMIITALLIESAGVASGRYYYPGYILYLSVVGGSVPLVVILGWSANLIMFLTLGKHIIYRIYQNRNYFQIFLTALAAGIIAVSLDLLEDPLAHHNNWWIWKTTTYGVDIFGVPILNFIGFFLLIFYMSLATLFIDRSKYSENRKILLSITSLSITGPLIFITHAIITRIFQFTGLD